MTRLHYARSAEGQPRLYLKAPLPRRGSLDLARGIRARAAGEIAGTGGHTEARDGALQVGQHASPVEQQAQHLQHAKQSQHAHETVGPGMATHRTRGRYIALPSRAWGLRS